MRSITLNYFNRLTALLHIYIYIYFIYIYISIYMKTVLRAGKPKDLFCAGFSLIGSIWNRIDDNALINPTVGKCASLQQLHSAKKKTESLHITCTTWLLWHSPQRVLRSSASAGLYSG